MEKCEIIFNCIVLLNIHSTCRLSTYKTVSHLCRAPAGCSESVTAIPACSQYMTSLEKRATRVSDAGGVEFMYCMKIARFIVDKFHD